MNPHPPISEEDKKKSYYKYYLRDMTAPAPEVYEKAAAARLTPDEVLSPHEVSRMFEPGYLPGEMGYCALPDGNFLYFDSQSGSYSKMRFNGETYETVDSCD